MREKIFTSTVLLRLQLQFYFVEIRIRQNWTEDHLILNSGQTFFRGLYLQTVILCLLFFYL